MARMFLALVLARMIVVAISVVMKVFMVPPLAKVALQPAKATDQGDPGLAALA
jgi:hypothetical protein